MVAANVVRDFHIGNTRIRIADNYCKKTASEVEWLLQRIAQQAQRQFNAAAAAGKYEQEKDTELPAAHCDGARGSGDDGGSVRNNRAGDKHPGPRPAGGRL